MRYALAPHKGAARAELVRLAGAINHLLWTARISPKRTGAFPAEHSFLSVTPPSVIVTAAKRAEDDDDLVLRFYESEGRDIEAQVRTAFPVATAREVNFMEDEIGKVPTRGRLVRVPLGHYEIKTLKIRPAEAQRRGEEVEP
jgi:alpha-mannosidase